MSERHPTQVELAFDPELRAEQARQEQQAQAEQQSLDLYLQSRPYKDDGGRAHDPVSENFVQPDNYFEEQREIARNETQVSYNEMETNDLSEKLGFLEASQGATEGKNGAVYDQHTVKGMVAENAAEIKGALESKLQELSMPDLARKLADAEFRSDGAMSASVEKVLKDKVTVQKARILSDRDGEHNRQRKENLENRINGIKDRELARLRGLAGSTNPGTNEDSSATEGTSSDAESPTPTRELTTPDTDDEGEVVDAEIVDAEVVDDPEDQNEQPAGADTTEEDANADSSDAEETSQEDRAAQEDEEPDTADTDEAPTREHDLPPRPSEVAAAIDRFNALLKDKTYVPTVEEYREMSALADLVRVTDQNFHGEQRVGYYVGGMQLRPMAARPFLDNLAKNKWLLSGHDQYEAQEVQDETLQDYPANTAVYDRREEGDDLLTFAEFARLKGRGKELDDQDALLVDQQTLDEFKEYADQRLELDEALREGTFTDYLVDPAEITANALEDFIESRQEQRADRRAAVRLSLGGLRRRNRLSNRRIGRTTRVGQAAERLRTARTQAGARLSSPVARARARVNDIRNNRRGGDDSGEQ